MLHLWVEHSKIESLSFRRSYANHEYLTDNQLDSLYKTNPVSEFEIKPNLLTQLNSKGIVKKNDLVLEYFDDSLHKRKIGKNIEVDYSYDFKESNSIDVLITKGKTKLKKHIEFDDHFIGIKYKDLDNDNIEELLILENYYIMNGDNFVLSIFKLSH